MTTPNKFHSAARPTAAELGLLPINEAVNKVVGETAVLLERPDGYSILVISANEGDWLLKAGDHAGAFPDDSTFTQTTTDTAEDGDAPWLVLEGRELAIAAPKEITVKGADANAVMRYYWA